MKNYLIRKHAQGHDPAYEYVDELPVGIKIGSYNDSAFYAVEPYVAHAKPYGLKQNKPAEIVVYGVAKNSLLFKFRDPSKVEVYDHYKTHEWDTCRFDQTTEGWRFVRSVIKVMKVLISVAKKAAVERRKVERDRAAAKVREGREGTCQICEGCQIIQPSGANKGTLVLHGYNRPGYGYTVGECFGYHRKPFEVATDALVEFIAMLKEKKAFVEKALANLPNLTSMHVEKNWRDKTLIEIFPDDDRWNRELNDRKYRYESELRSLEGAIWYQEQRLANWKPEPNFLQKWARVIEAL